MLINLSEKEYKILKEIIEERLHKEEIKQYNYNILLKEVKLFNNESELPQKGKKDIVYKVKDYRRESMIIKGNIFSKSTYVPFCKLKGNIYLWNEEKERYDLFICEDEISDLIEMKGEGKIKINDDDIKFN